MHKPKTPWTKPSTIPSDRIRPKYQQEQKSTSSKKKALRSVQIEEHKSGPVRRLEALISGLNASTASIKIPHDPKGGCFCLAREHPLSPYTPLCMSCGLVLCNLNKPYHACPHCSSSLLRTSEQRNSLLVQLNSELEATLAKEQAERERAIEEVKRAAGAFPSLPSTSSSQSQSNVNSLMTPSIPTALITPETHKVLSLNSKTKRVTVSSYTNSPISSRPVSRNSVASTATPDDEEGFGSSLRVPPPSPHANHAVDSTEISRPWKNLLLIHADAKEDIKYIPPKHGISSPARNRSTRRKSKDKGKEKGKEKENLPGNDGENLP